MIKNCPKCGSDIVYSFGTSYYLRCNRDYNCWHQHCDKETALKYPEYLSPSAEGLAYRMREKLLNDDSDYFHDDNL